MNLHGQWMTTVWLATCDGTYLKPRMDQRVYERILDPLRDTFQDVSWLLIHEADGFQPLDTV